MNFNNHIPALILAAMLAIGCAACSVNEASTQDETPETPEAAQTVDVEITANPVEETPESEAEAVPPSPYEPPEPDSVSEGQETGNTEEAPSIHTYTTSDIIDGYQVTCPVFQFDYPDGWTVTAEETGDRIIIEWDILSNERGVTITYMQFAPSNIFNYGRFLSQIDATKIADSSFIPGMAAGGAEDCSYLGDFMVAELRTIGALFMDLDTDYRPVEDIVCYAVVPESYAGIHDFVRGIQGVYSEFSFAYPTARYVLIAEAPKGHFTESEAEEVIAILSSFRVVN